MIPLGEGAPPGQAPSEAQAPSDAVAARRRKQRRLGGAGVASVVAAVLAAWIVAALLARAEDRELERLRDGLARVAEAEAPSLYGLSPTGVEPRPQASRARELLRWLELAEPGLRVYLVGPRGVIFETEPRLAGHEPRSIAVRELRAAVEGQSGMPPWAGDDPEGGRGRFLASALEVGGAQTWYLYAVLEPRREGSGTGVARWAIASGLGSMVGLGAFLVAGLASRQEGRRLRSLTVRVAELGRRLGAVTSEALYGTREGASEPQRDGGGLADPSRGGRDLLVELERELEALESRLDRTLERLDARARAQRELLANAAHDLRTPLASLRGYLETLSLPTRSLDEAGKREYLEIALRQSERLSRLVQDLFDLSRLESQALPAFERFHLGELVQDNVQRLRLRAEGVGIELSARFEADLPPVTADVGLMERALQNLLDNALRHTPSGGTVEVRLEERAGRVEVAVSDTGSGIAPEDLPRIFERFYRSRGKQASKTGAGFGLAIAARIAELHGGRLDVESALGEGSTFRFDLEIAAPTRARITAPAGV